MKRIIALFVVLIMMGSLLAACQPNPTTPPVVGVGSLLTVNAIDGAVIDRSLGY